MPGVFVFSGLPRLPAYAIPRNVGNEGKRSNRERIGNVEQDPWRTVAHAAGRLGVSESQVRILIRARRLAGHRHTIPRGKWQIRESEIVRYLAALEATAPVAA
jgi:excisionase family DNA binding protein